MTRQMRWIIGDDLIAYESKGKEHADADETLVIAIGRDMQHLKAWEVDLTKANAGELREFLSRYQRAGRAPGSEPGPGGPARAPQQAAGGQRPREIPGTRVFYRKLRDFAGKHGFDFGPNPKNRKYAPQLYEAYQAHLEERTAADPHGPDSVQLAMGYRLGVFTPAQPG